MPLEIGACVGEIESADLALDREAGLGPLVLLLFGKIAAGGEITARGLIGKGTVRCLHLSHAAERGGPVLIEIDLECSAAAIGLDRVLIAADELRVVAHHARGGVSFAAWPADIVDIAAVILIEANNAQCRMSGERQVDIAFGDAARFAMRGSVGGKIGRAGEALGIGLVGNDAQGARLAARAKQGALRAGQRLDPRDVIDVDIERRADCGDWLLIEIDANGGQRTSREAVAVGQAAEIDLSLPGTIAGVGHARQEFRVIVEIAHIALRKGFGGKRLDRERHVLKLLRTLLRGDDDLIGRGRRVCRCLIGRQIRRLRMKRPGRDKRRQADAPRPKLRLAHTNHIPVRMPKV